MNQAGFAIFLLVVAVACLILVLSRQKAARVAQERAEEIEQQARQELYEQRQLEIDGLSIEEARQRAESLMTDPRHFALTPAPANPDVAVVNLLNQLAPNLRLVLSRFDTIEPAGNWIVVGARPRPARVGLSLLRPMGNDAKEIWSQNADTWAWWRVSEHEDMAGLEGYWLKIGEHNGVGEYVVLPGQEGIYRVDAWLNPPGLPEPETLAHSSIYHWILDYASLT